jgi:integrase
VPLARLHRRDLQAVVDAVAGGRAKVEGAPMSKGGSPTTAARVAAMLGAAINWLHQRGHVETHPCPGGLDRPAANGPRDRILTDAEIKAVWKACEGREPAGRVVRLLLLTGCRREEVNGLSEGEVERDGEGNPVALLLPAERTKAGRAHRVPLSLLAADLIAKAPHTGDVLFPGRHASIPFKGWSRAVEDIQRLSKTGGWTPHDLRRTCASGLARLGVRPDIIDRVLNHAPPRLRRTYDRHDYAPELRDALARWADYVARVVS